ncbi:hypothetical protein WA158_000436 [Blastocystis sp. Blastoise]
MGKNKSKSQNKNTPTPTSETHPDESQVQQPINGDAVLSELRSKVETLEKENSTVKSEYDLSVKRCACVEGMLKVLREKDEKNRKTISSLEDTIKNYGTTNTSKDTAYVSVIESTFQEQENKLNQTIESLTNENKTLKLVNQHLTETIHEHEIDDATNQIALDESRNEYDNEKVLLEMKVNELKDTVASQKENIETLEFHNIELTNEKNDIISSYSYAIERYNSIFEELSKKENENDTLINELIIMSELDTKQKELVSSLSVAIEKYIQKIQSLKEEKKKIELSSQQCVMAFTKQITDITSQNNDFLMKSKEFDEIQAINNDQKVDIEKKMKDIEMYKKQIEELNDTIDKLKKSSKNKKNNSNPTSPVPSEKETQLEHQVEVINIQCEELKKQLVRAEEAIEVSKEQLISLQEEKNNISIKNQDLVSQCDLLKTNESQLKNTVTEKESLLNEKETLLNEKNTVIAEKDTLLSEKDTLLSEKIALLTEKIALLSEKESQSKKHEEEYTTLLTEFNTLKSSSSKTIEELKKNIEKNKKDLLLLDTSSMVPSLVSQYYQLYEENNVYTSMINQLKNTIEEQKKQIHDSHSSVEELEKKVLSLESVPVVDCTPLKEEIEEKKQSICLLEKEADSLHCQLNDYEDKIQQVEEEKNSVENNLKEIENKCNTVSIEKEKKEKECEDIRKQYMSLQNEYTNQQTIIRQQSNDLCILPHIITCNSDLSMNNTVLQKTIDTYKQEKKEIEQINHSLECQLNEYKNKKPIEPICTEEEYQCKCNEILNQQDKIQVIEHEKEKIIHSLKDKEEEIQSLEEEVKQLSKERDQVKATNNDLKMKSEQKIESLNSIISEMSKEAELTKQSIKEKELEINELNKKEEAIEIEMNKKNILLEEKEKKIEEINNMYKKEIEEINNKNKKEIEEINNKNKKEIEDINNKNNNKKKLEEKEKQSLEIQLDDITKKYNDIYDKYISMCKEKDNLDNEEKQSNSKNTTLSEELSVCKKNIKDMKKNIDDKMSQITKIEEEKKKMNKEIGELKSSLHKLQGESKNMNETKKKNEEEKKELEMKVKQLENDINQLTKDMNNKQESNQVMYIKLEHKYKDAMDTLKELEPLKETVAEYKEQTESSENYKKQLENEKKMLKASQEKSKKDVEKMKKQIEEQKQQLDDFKKIEEERKAAVADANKPGFIQSIQYIIIVIALLLGNIFQLFREFF